MTFIVEYNQINHLLCHFLSGPGLQSISKKIQLFQSSFSWRCDSPTYGFYACRFRCLVFCTCAGSSFFLSPSSTQFGLIVFLSSLFYLNILSSLQPLRFNSRDAFGPPTGGHNFLLFFFFIHLPHCFTANGMAHCEPKCQRDDVVAGVGLRFDGSTKRIQWEWTSRRRCWSDCAHCWPPQTVLVHRDFS